MNKFFIICMNRTRASAMLLVWMFSLVSGVANACLLEAPGATHASETVQASQHDASRVSLNRHIQTEAGLSDHDDTHNSKQPCLKFCDDSSKSLPKKYAASQIDPGSSMIIARLWSSAESSRVEFKMPIISNRTALLLPIRVLYARLAL